MSEERQWGIDAGLAWRAVAEATVVYVDRGVNAGMNYGIVAAKKAGIPVEYRMIIGEPRWSTERGSEWINTHPGEIMMNDDPSPSSTDCVTLGETRHRY